MDFIGQLPPWVLFWFCLLWLAVLGLLGVFVSSACDS